MDSNSYYRPTRNTESPITATSTDSSVACSALEADGCADCHAPYGHYIQCKAINTRTAEAHALDNPADVLRASALGIDLTKSEPVFKSPFKCLFCGEVYEYGDANHTHN